MGHFSHEKVLYMKALSQLKIEIDQAMTKTGEGIYVSSQLLQHVKMWW